MKTADLIGPALDWAVATCEGKYELKPGPRMLAIYDVFDGSGCPRGYFNPSTDWAQGGPIIEREGIELRYVNGADVRWAAIKWGLLAPPYTGHQSRFWEDGPTPLIAAMRCYVASKLGDEVEIPKELR